MRRLQLALIAAVFLHGPRVAGQETLQGLNAWMGAVVGQHFTGEILSPTFFPVAEFRAGYRVHRDFTTRFDLGLGFARVAGSSQESFEGAMLMVANLSLAFLYTPELSDTFKLNLGGSFGLWFSAMWGEEDLLGTVAGSERRYLESTSLSYGLVAGGEWDVTREWALVLECRANLAKVKWGDEYNTGGVTALLGFLYRIKAPGD